ncbi:hypothetical protein ACRB68_34740 [Actinomadura sp. RB68]|uniref:Uncharacterized protein n=1 Tax=Actinomadura macrotermitis TaxID=2585200 RepID=A0A7K0BW41_9ACTN|nr:hypothetical protein [Actinomadura macrotermitis]
MGMPAHGWRERHGWELARIVGWELALAVVAAVVGKIIDCLW